MLSSKDIDCLNKQLLQELQQSICQACALLCTDEKSQQIAKKLLDQTIKIYKIKTYSLTKQTKCQLSSILTKIFPQKGKLFPHYRDIYPTHYDNIQLVSKFENQVMEKAFLGEQLNNQKEGFKQFKSKRVIDLGCGSGIYGLSLVRKMSSQLKKKVDMQFYDFSKSIASGCYYNIIQQDFLDEVNSILFQDSDMFMNIPNPKKQQCLLLAALPQSPFPTSGVEPGRNGGQDTLKFNTLLLKHFSQFYRQSNSSLIMMYMNFSNPKIFFDLFDQNKLDITWKTDHIQRFMTSQKYEELLPGLTQFIKDHIKRQNSLNSWEDLKDQSSGKTVSKFKILEQIYLVQCQKK